MVSNTPSLRVKRSIPSILSVEEVSRLIQFAPDLKRKTMIMCLYATGIRLFELASLKIKNIDSGRMQIKILGKGNKERYIILSQSLLHQLRKYWVKYRPKVYLFENPHSNTKYHTRVIQWHFERIKMKAGITKAGNIHLLRHAFTTHLIENGTPIYLIQKLLGHKKITSTTNYLWLTNSSLRKVPCPLGFISNLQEPQQVEEEYPHYY